MRDSGRDAAWGRVRRRMRRERLGRILVTVFAFAVLVAAYLAAWFEVTV